MLHLEHLVFINMQAKTSNLQIVIDTKLRDKSEAVAKEYGFSSLQDLVRFVLTGVSERRLEPALVDRREYISPEAEKRYMKDIEEFEKLEKQGKAPKPAYSVKQLMKQLKEDSP